MKSKFLVALLCAMFCVGGALNAQAPYRHSVGGVGCTMWGFSYKTFLSEHVALSVDLGNQFIQTGGEDWPQVDVYSIELNPNLMYEFSSNSRLHSFIGAGVTLGYNWEMGIWHIWYSGGTRDTYKYLGNGMKAGANVIAGLEYIFKIPLAVQLDFRPGYGVFIKDNVRWNHFDWNLCLGIRYTF